MHKSSFSHCRASSHLSGLLLSIVFICGLSIDAGAQKAKRADSEKGKGVITPGKAKKGSRHPAYSVVVDDPALPRVLIVGDSISIGYTAPTRKCLKGVANVHRVRANAGDTQRGLEQLDHWLKPELGKWDLIHFNFGLWDLCYRNPKTKNQGNRDKQTGKLTHTVDEYSRNLEEIVVRLKKTGATLVFATTTPVPEKEPGRIAGDAIRYNKAALVVMKKHGIKVNDLHSTIAPQMEVMAKAPGDVHFKPKGYQYLAAQTAKVISENLPEKPRDQNE